MSVPIFQRFMFANQMTAENSTASSGVTPVVRQFTKANRFGELPGGSRGRTVGNFTGLVDTDWIVEIFSAGSVGSAQYRYSIDGGTTWAGTGTTSTSPVLLEQGVSFEWTVAMFGADFAIGDRWTFKTIIPYSLLFSLNYQDRGIPYRSADDDPVTIDVDLGTLNAIIKCGSVLDHNLSDTATIRLQGNTTQSWGSSPFDMTFDSEEGMATAFWPEVNYRYWRWTFTDSGNEDGYIQIGEIYLGTYYQLPHRSAGHLPWKENITANIMMSDSSRGVSRKQLDNLPRVFPLFWEFVPEEDSEILEALRSTMWNETLKVHTPVIFSPDHTSPKAYLCWVNTFDLREIFPNKWRCSMDLDEVSKKID